MTNGVRAPIKADSVIIGSGPAGQQAAIECARHGQSVVVVEKQQVIGGVCLHTGTMPSKALREAVLGLTGWRQHALGQPAIGPVAPDECIGALHGVINRVLEKELAVIAAQLAKLRIRLLFGKAEWLDPHTLAVLGPDGEQRVQADSFIIAVGTVANRPAGIPFNNHSIIDSDEIFKIAELPKRLVIIGGGVVALEYATIFLLLGIQVTVIFHGDEILPFLDGEIIQALRHFLAARGVALYSRAGIKEILSGQPPHTIVLDSGERIGCDMVLAAAGRRGVADELKLERIGLTPNDSGLLAVDAAFRTAIGHIYAAGDIIGFPATASTAKVQGRMAALHLLNHPERTRKIEHLPFGIYTIPEIGYCGQTETELADSGTPYVKGVARFREVAKGEIIGDDLGFLKLLFHRQTLQLLGVHIFGTDAAELVHIGQSALFSGETCEQMIAKVYNYPTLSEAYKIAALDAERQLQSQSS